MDRRAASAAQCVRAARRTDPQPPVLPTALPRQNAPTIPRCAQDLQRSNPAPHPSEVRHPPAGHRLRLGRRSLKAYHPPEGYRLPAGYHLPGGRHLPVGCRPPEVYRPPAVPCPAAEHEPATPEPGRPHMPVPASSPDRHTHRPVRPPGGHTPTAAPSADPAARQARRTAGRWAEPVARQARRTGCDWGSAVAEAAGAPAQATAPSTHRLPRQARPSGPKHPTHPDRPNHPGHPSAEEHSSDPRPPPYPEHPPYPGYPSDPEHPACLEFPPYPEHPTRSTRLTGRRGPARLRCPPRLRCAPHRDCPARSQPLVRCGLRRTSGGGRQGLAWWFRLRWGSRGHPTVGDERGVPGAEAGRCGGRSAVGAGFGSRCQPTLSPL
jgi:hypothetical protein